MCLEELANMAMLHPAWILLIINWKSALFTLLKKAFKCGKEYKANNPLRAAMIHHAVEQ